MNISIMDKRLWKLRVKLWKIKGKEFYMKYARILALALIEIVAELYNSSRERR